MTVARPASDLLSALLERQAVLFPTDTVPALGIRPEAAAQIWELKQRPAHKPLILMGADTGQLVDAFLEPWPRDWLAEAERVWPGPVTLVLPLSGALQAALNPGGTSLGLRVPNCAMAQSLLRQSGPLATTSVNRSGEPPALSAEEAGRMFPFLPLLAPLPWPAGSGIASEVRAWDQGNWTVLRAGRSAP
ncbi:MAG: Sua5/YciO/YrdC/YwlC family protein [Cyanobacteriota bacterium]|nr:Sua5/YciO/YrdC/YwlC family protein [Cyanobacteriota bacterium]